MSCARGVGVWEGMSGRKPRCMTAKRCLDATQPSIWHLCPIIAQLNSCLTGCQLTSYDGMKARGALGMSIQK